MATLSDFDWLTQTRYALIVLLLFDTCQHTRYHTSYHTSYHTPASASHGLQSNDIMFDCLCLFACLIVGSCLARGIMCRLYRQSADNVPDSLIDGDPSTTWRHAVQVWRPPLVLSMGRRNTIGAADDDPNNDGLCL